MRWIAWTRVENISWSAAALWQLFVEDESFEQCRWKSNYTIWNRWIRSLWIYAYERKFSTFMPQCPLIPSLLQLNDFGLAWEENSMNTDETQTKAEQCWHCCHVPAHRKRTPKHYQDRRFKSPWNYLRPAFEKILMWENTTSVFVFEWKTKRENCMRNRRKYTDAILHLKANRFHKLTWTR